MEGRKWEDLNMDCLVNVLGRVGIESLLLEVPFVCTSWYRATLNPLCWRKLDFLQTFDVRATGGCSFNFMQRLYEVYQIQGLFNYTAFIKCIIKRSDRSATSLCIPLYYAKEVLLYAADECPNLRFLGLPNYPVLLNNPDKVVDVCSLIPSLVSKWKNLEILVLASRSISSYETHAILAQVSIHCKNFVGLAIPSTGVWEDDASDIVKLVPRIKYLNLMNGWIKRESLVIILQGCKELEYFNATNCYGFKEGDEEILKQLASGVTRFEDKGATESNFEDWFFFSREFFAGADEIKMRG